MTGDTYSEMMKAQTELSRVIDECLYDGGDAINARDYEAEGFALGEAAFDLPQEDRADHIDGESYAFPAGYRAIVAYAADFRLAALVHQAVMREAA